MSRNYLIRNPAALAGMRCLDGLLSLWSRKATIAQPRKLLLTHLLHLGDVLLMTSLLPMFKRAIPDLEIGVVVGSWAQSIVHNHPLISKVHFLDHWKINRSLDSRFQKWRRYRQMYRVVLREIQGYDIAIECSPYFPNTISLITRARIPVRIGYSSGGLGPLLTHELPWTGEEKSMAEHMADLAALVVERSPLQMVLPPLPVVPISLPKQYLVIHVGSGDVRKEWPKEFWRQSCERLSAAGHFLVFSGKGPREREMIAYISNGLPRALNVCDRLSWLETVALIRDARLLVGVDTATGHAAAAVEAPAVLIYNGIHSIAHWKPLGSMTHPLVRPSVEQLLCAIEKF